MEEGWMHRMVQFLDLWAIRIAVLSSLGAHLVLVILAGRRRRKGSCMWTFLLWLAYQLANWTAPYALGNLSFGSTSQEQQLVAFWASFLLQHLGGPDNITAYTLEDNVLSGREAMSVVMQIGGATYVLYKHIYIGGDGGGALLPASILIFTVGVAKYVERAIALRRGDLGNIQSSSKKKEEESVRSCSLLTMVTGGDQDHHHVLDDEEALMVAHNMFPFCRRAMTDSSVQMGSPDLDTGRKLFSCRWENMCKVVEMELSLMYDILYTKTAMVHTWGGYFIRLMSPLATAAAFFLFCFYNKDGQRRADVIITYILLATTFLLDMRWLLRALGSTWTHAFLKARPQEDWLRHGVLHSRRWHKFRRLVVSLEYLTAPSSSSSYRKWSGVIGQYCLLKECSRDTTGLCRRALKKIYRSQGLELSQDVKGLVFKRLGKILKSTYQGKDMDASYSMKDITTCWGQVAVKKRKRALKECSLAFGREFQEDILVWHIATQAFLLSIRDTSRIRGNKAETHVEAIKALSKYLMFLVVVRQHMLPGLVLRSLYEVTRDALQAMWRHNKSKGSSATTGADSLDTLVRILVGKKHGYRVAGLKKDQTRLVSDGANLARELLDASHLAMPEILKLVFNVWVEKLLYAGTRCSRESHARQLGRGSELTTMVWILAEHAGPFQIGEERPQDYETSDDEIEKALEKKDGSGGSVEGKKPEGKKPQEGNELPAGVLAGYYHPGYYHPGYYPMPRMSPVDPSIPPDQREPVQTSWTPLDRPWMPAGPVPQPGEPPKDIRYRRERSRRYATLYPVT
ncbi:hypothetical protein ZWY2020_031379 [Hordeum vulgare]|nr:hypothetical protein ZWY2020_031379 [Hordeum vulgare]